MIVCSRVITATRDYNEKRGLDKKSSSLALERYCNLGIFLMMSMILTMVMIPSIIIYINIYIYIYIYLFISLLQFRDKFRGRRTTILL
jgi:hypothetical protein